MPEVWFRYTFVIWTR